MFGSDDNNQVNSPTDPILGSQSAVASDPNIPYQVQEVVEKPVIPQMSVEESALPSISAKPLVEEPTGPTLKEVMEVLVRIEERLARIEGIKEAGGFGG